MAIIRNLKLYGHTVFLVAKKNNYADASRYLDLFIPCSYTSSSPDFLNLILEVINKYGIETIIPMSDVHSEFLSINKELLGQYVSYKMPDINIWRRGVNKDLLMLLCKEKGYPIPFTVSSEKLSLGIEENDLPYPLLIKPNITCGARGMTLIHSYNELKKQLPRIEADYGKCHIQQYIKPGGAQVECQLFIDEDQNLVNSSVIYKYRWYPEKGGSSCCAVSVKNDKIIDILYHLLLDLNWVGFADFDTIEDPETGELLIMELNPRVPACVKCPISAGIHWGQIIVDGYLGNSQKFYKYKEGEFLRHLGFEILWFIKSPYRFKTKPNWFKFIGKHIHYQDISSWSDPKPFLLGTLKNIKKVLKRAEKEKIER